MQLLRYVRPLLAAGLLGATLRCSPCVECLYSDELATCEGCAIDGVRTFCKRGKELSSSADGHCEYSVVPRGSELSVPIDLATEPDYDEVVIETRVEGSLDGVTPTLNGSPIPSCSPQPPNKIVCHPLPPAPFTMVLRNDQRDIEKVGVKSWRRSCNQTIRSCPL